MLSTFEPFLTMLRSIPFGLAFCAAAVGAAIGFAWPLVILGKGQELGLERFAVVAAGGLLMALGALSMVGRFFFA